MLPGRMTIAEVNYVQPRFSAMQLLYAVLLCHSFDVTNSRQMIAAELSHSPREGILGFDIFLVS